MGLDGISINQLRVTPELNSAELNSAQNINSQESKVVDGLSEGQRVDNEKEKEHDSQGYEFNQEENEEEETEQEAVTKYDLSDANKFSVKLDEDTNKILIYEKSTKNLVQAIDADELTKLVSFAPNSCGSIVNKKF